MMAPELCGIHMNSSFEVPSCFGRAVFERNLWLFISTLVKSSVFICTLEQKSTIHVAEMLYRERMPTYETSRDD